VTSFTVACSSIFNVNAILNMADTVLAHKVFSDKCKRIRNALGETEGIVQSLLHHNSQFPLKYPSLGLLHLEKRWRIQGKRNRSKSFLSAHSPTSSSSSSSFDLSSTHSLDDSGVYSSSGATPQTDLEDVKPLSILSLDLKLPHASCDISLESLEQSSTSKLLENKLTYVLGHLSKLGLRVGDVQSKILVTGDLNAGKSTLINSLLKRPTLLPTDQQPCTTNLCEVLDAEKFNDGVEEVHAIPVAAVYNKEDPLTFKRFELFQLERLACDSFDTFEMLKVYCLEPHQPNSLLQNDVQVSLIDSPGLNRDSLKTMAVFAREQEVDVIVFVVNAENHFTLSVTCGIIATFVNDVF
jgi:mitofusin